MTICGVLVHAKTDLATRISTQLQTMPGVEIHAKEQGRLVVTVSSEHDAKAADAILDMQRLDGVLSAALVYHYSDMQESQA